MRLIRHLVFFSLLLAALLSYYNNSVCRSFLHLILLVEEFEEYDYRTVTWTQAMESFSKQSWNADGSSAANAALSSKQLTIRNFIFMILKTHTLRLI